MDSLLQEINTQEEISVQYSTTRRRSSFTPNKFHNTKSFNIKKGNPPSNNKSCILCKTAGRPHQGHDITKCWFISRFEKLQISKAFAVAVDNNSDDSIGEENLIQSVNDNNQSHTEALVSLSEVSNVQKVQCDVSPYMYAFYKHHPCHIVIDTGAASSLISKSFLTTAGIKINPTYHSTRDIVILN